ncbi:MAG TPA: hypothetical protein VK524_13760, partial [Polyangiaceae bacterium]|nr:hypothetical protein [Polyangiaceae bacterium]
MQRLLFLSLALNCACQSDADGPEPALGSTATKRVALAEPAWIRTAPLGEAPASKERTLRLRDGRVLVSLGTGLRSALYDPRAGTWVFTAPNFPTNRSVVLGDGRVLAGLGNSWDPATNTVIQSQIVHTGGSLPSHYTTEGGSATVLADGKVLFRGGLAFPNQGYFGPENARAKYVFDPVTNTWSGSPYGGFSSGGHAAVRLADGRVLTVGGLIHGYCSGGPFEPTPMRTSTASAAIYDPKTGVFTDVAPMREPREAPASVLLPNGKVLVVSAEYSAWKCDGHSPTGAVVRNQFAAEIYDPETDTWQVAAGQTLESGPLILLPRGNVFLASAQPALFHPIAESWAAVPPNLDAPRNVPSAALLDGGVLVVGGWHDPNYSFWPTAEIYVGAHLAGQLGDACATSAECRVGQCVDGVCCDRACAGQCEACSAAKKGAGTVDGRCGPVLNGNDPDQECEQWGCGTCRNSGSCNGTGACDDRTGSYCGSPACTAGGNGTLVADTCSAAGLCEPAVVHDCSPGLCDSALRRCRLECDDTHSCAPDAFCSGVKCERVGSLAKGKYCSIDAQCASNYCDRSNCGEPCDERCRACELLGVEAASP